MYAGAAAARRLEGLDVHLRTALVIADDAKGGWTNRYTTEMSSRFDARYDVRHGWVLPLLWSSETAGAGRVRQAVQAQVFRIAYMGLHGPTVTLGEHMRQEGWHWHLPGRTSRCFRLTISTTRAVCSPICWRPTPIR